MGNAYYAWASMQRLESRLNGAIVKTIDRLQDYMGTDQL